MPRSPDQGNVPPHWTVTPPPILEPEPDSPPPIGWTNITVPPSLECHDENRLRDRRRTCTTCLTWYCVHYGCENHGGIGAPGTFVFSDEGSGYIYTVCADHLDEYTAICGRCQQRAYNATVSDAGCGTCTYRCSRCRNRVPRAEVHDCPALREAALGRVPRWVGAVASQDPLRPRSRIQNYSYKPHPVFFGRSRKNLYFGIEQEVEARPQFSAEEVATSVLNLDTHGLLYAKRDSSMYDGVEFVSHPMTFSWFTQNYSVELARKLEEVADNQRDGHYTTGVHVHLSRDAFTGYHLFKFVEFFLSNPEFVQFVAGRGDTADDAQRGTHKIAAYEKDALVISPDDTRIRSTRGRVVTPTGDVIYSSDFAIRDYAYAGKQDKHPWDMPPNRYVAVNLQNRQTVEVRVFRGTVKYERLRAYVQFMDAAYAFTKEAHWRSKNPVNAVTEVGFRTFITRFPRRYADLINLLNREGVWAEA